VISWTAACSTDCRSYMLQLGIEHNSANNKCMNDSAHGQCVGSLFAVGHIYRQRLWQGVVSVDLQEMYIDM